MKKLKNFLSIILMIGALGLIVSFFSEKIVKEEPKEESPLIDQEQDVNGDQSGEDETPYVEVHSFALVGSMNEWNVINQDYLMDSNGNLTYTIELEVIGVPLEFKIADHQSWDWQYNMNNVINDDSTYIDFNSSDNIIIVENGLYEINLDVNTHEVHIDQLEKYGELITFRLHDGSNSYTYSVLEGTTWEEFIESSKNDSPFYIDEGLVVCENFGLQTLNYEDDHDSINVKSDHVILADFYGVQVYITFVTDDYFTEFFVISGMTWEDVIPYYNEVVNKGSMQIIKNGSWDEIKVVYNNREYYIIGDDVFSPEDLVVEGTHTLSESPC